MNTKFDVWLGRALERLFAVEDAYSEEGKFLMSTRYPKTNAIKVALEVYQIKSGFKKLKGNKNLTEKMITDILPSKYKESALMVIERNPRFLVKCGENDFTFALLEKHDKEKNMQSISSVDDTERGTEPKEVNRMIKRYMKQSEQILQNVCDCQSP